MEHFCWFIKLLFLLLMMLKMPTLETRPLRGAQHSDIIAGNEFLKLFLARDELQRELHSSEYQGRRAGGGSYYDDNLEDNAEEIATTSKASGRSTSARSLDYKSRNLNEHSRNEAENSQVVKLVTSGSKIVFLEDEYDEEHAVADAVDIELKKEQLIEPRAAAEPKRRRNQSDEVKVVAVSMSSSSKRHQAQAQTQAHANSAAYSLHARQMNSIPMVPAEASLEAHSRRQQQQHHQLLHQQRQAPKEHQQQQLHRSQQHAVSNSSTSKPLTTRMTTTTTTTERTTPTTSTTTTSAPPAVEFINRSHKSELLIEEAEPLTMPQSGKSAHSAPTSFSTATDLFYDTDSENSASTNIRNVLAAPLARTPTTTPASESEPLPHSAAGTTTYHSSNRTSARINQLVSRTRVTHADNNNMPAATMSPAAAALEDKLLPFQTVIYHDTKEGHGPQSRSISYSSISQNVEDLQAWQKSGILAEAQRNVSESLKPLVRSPAEPHHTHGSEPSKFYSLPSQMYSVPAKFYSEPAKVYSEPAKVYGQPEKFYSEPAKVYGQPAKFYSEPSKVYSQPAKVYGEPAKTYWPRQPQVATTDSPTSISTTTSTTTTPTLTPFAASSSRRPAIVSRIAFGEAQTTQVPTITGQQPAQTNLQHNQYSHHSHQQQQQQQSHSNANSQARRVLFNLDKLPYDLLNAPEQSPKHLLQPALSRHIPLSSNGGGGFNGGRQRPCLEPPSTSSTSQQHQQHSSLLDQHSNQNAKGLPNRDLVKCVSKYSHSAAAASSLANQRPTAYTTERSHIEDLYTPTPEQNYEIEESVSVMTNGRAHGVQGIGGPTTATTARSRIRAGGIAGQHGALYNTNVNANADDVEQSSTDENYDEDGTDPSDNDNDNEGDVAGTVSQHSGGGKHNNGGGNAEDDSKVAYVVEGRNYRKYRVEEKTDDGFIVGEYGVLDHHDGNLRGVRYTADSTINRSLIQKALLTFLKLK